MKYMNNGAPIPSSVPTSKSKEREHKNLFGIFRGIIIRAVYPDDPANTIKTRMEYVVKVRGQEYPNAINIRESGGIYNYRERVRKGTEKSESNQLNAGTFDELLDGEHVYVAFLEGYAASPLILGAAEHPLHSKYKKPSSADGVFEVTEFNGVEISIDKESNYLIKHLGMKDKDGNITNPNAVDTFFKINSNGDIELNNGAKILMDDNGIIVEDQFQNKIEMKDGQVNIHVNGDANVGVTGNANLNVGGDASVSADGKATFKGAGGTDLGESGSETNVNGSLVKLAGGGVGVARIGDMVVGTGNHGAPVISTIISGSTKVSAG